MGIPGWSNQAVSGFFRSGSTVSTGACPENNLISETPDTQPGKTIDEPGVRIVNPPGLNAGVGNVVALELPAMVFGKEQFQSGDKIDFTSTLVTHGQAYRVEWEGSFVLQ